MSTDIIYCESDQKYCAFNGAPTTTVMQVQLPKEPPTANTMCRQFAVKGYLTATVMRSLSGLLCFESGPQQPLQCATYEFCFWRENTHMVPFCNYCHTKSVTSSHPSSRWYGSWFTQLANHLRDAFRELWTRLRCVLCKGLFFTYSLARDAHMECYSKQIPNSFLLVHVPVCRSFTANKRGCCSPSNTSLSCQNFFCHVWVWDQLFALSKFVCFLMRDIAKQSFWSQIRIKTLNNVWLNTKIISTQLHCWLLTWYNVVFIIGIFIFGFVISLRKRHFPFLWIDNFFSWKPNVYLKIT